MKTVIYLTLITCLTSCGINQKAARHEAYKRFHYKQYLKDSLRINHINQ